MAPRKPRLTAGSMQFHKQQRQPKAAVSPFMMHATRKAAHQVNAEIAHFRLLERLCHRQGWELGRIEFPAAILNPGDQRLAIALLSSIDERAEHGLDHGFDGRIIDALSLRQLGRDGFEVAIACRWRQRHRSLAHDRELAVGQAQNAIGFSEVHRGQIPVQA